MGVQKALVQRLIFHSMDNTSLGIHILTAPTYKFQIMILDNMLHMHPACLVPMTDGKPPPHTAAELTAHIMGSVVRTYVSMARNADLVVLCDDGTVNFKPAVREARNNAPVNEATLFLRQNMALLRQVLFNRLMREGVPFVHILGTGARHAVTGALAPGAITVGELCDDEAVAAMHLDAFGRTLRSSESDTIMYELVLHLRKSGNSASVGILSRDSDIVPTAMAVLVRHGADVLGDTTLGFLNPLFYRTDVTTKDFPTAVANLGWNPAMHARVPAPAALHPRVLSAPDADLVASDAVWDLMYDCERARGHFEEAMVGMRERILGKSLNEARLLRLFGTLYENAVRGPLFRRFVEWLIEGDADFFLHTDLEKFIDFAVSGSTKHFAKHYKKLLEDWIEKAPDSMNSNKPSHAAAVLRCNKQYLAGNFPAGMYGRYLDRLTATAIVFMRIHRTPRSWACVVLCGLAGADYNISLIKMGGQRAVDLLTNERFRVLCEGVRDDTLEDRGTMIRLINEIGVGHNKGSFGITTETLNGYLEGVFRTLVYTLGVWSLTFPPADEAHGFRGDGFIFPLSWNWPILQKVLTLSKGSDRFEA